MCFESFGIESLRAFEHSNRNRRRWRTKRRKGTRTASTFWLLLSLARSWVYRFLKRHNVRMSGLLYNGAECEYRHCDFARLNPRDCWYWLNGNCLNPNCAFRHPPIEGFDGASSISAVSSNKSNVPCYFFLNAICAKGEQCPYLHGTLSSQKVSNGALEAPSDHPQEYKISNGDLGLVSTELPANHPSEILAPAKTVNQERNPSAESIALQREEQVVNLIPSPDFSDHDNGQLSSYQSSEELDAKECSEQELDERWESSPGFDVLVGGGSDNLAYADDAEYQLSQNGEESELLHGCLPHYDHICYPNGSYLYNKLYESYDHSDDIYASDYLQRSSELLGEHGHHHRKRKLQHRVHDNDDDVAVDLRERLGTQRTTDADWLTGNPRKRGRSLSYANKKGREQFIRHGGDIGRLSFRVGRRVITGEEGYVSRERRFPARSRHHRERERRRHRDYSCFSSESSVLDSEEYTVAEVNGFAGPKPLPQIKEKNRANKKDDFQPWIRRRWAEAADFEGPKPLEELLRGKRRLENRDVESVNDS